MIQSLGDRRAAAIFAGYAVRDWPLNLQKRARAKLLALDAAAASGDLRTPPGNHLEALRATRSGRNSIRINDLWRICFVRRSGAAWDVEIADYH